MYLEGKNKDEISSTHFLAMGEYGEQNGQSIQNILMELFILMKKDLTQ